MGFSLTSGVGVNGNAPYQAQELQITTLANPRRQTNFPPPNTKWQLWLNTTDAKNQAG